MELVAIDWLRDIKRMDHVARRKGCAAQVAAEKGMFTFVVNIQVRSYFFYGLSSMASFFLLCSRGSLQEENSWFSL
jgi:hypothetical protein